MTATAEAMVLLLQTPRDSRIAVPAEGQETVTVGMHRADSTADLNGGGAAPVTRGRPMMSTGMRDLGDPANQTDSLVAPAQPGPGPAEGSSFGNYELLDELGRGGMGVVYRARQIDLNRLVALKVILWGSLSNPTSLRRFRIEAETAGRLDHPGIVTVFHVGEHDGYPYYAMALVEGRSLAQCLSQGPMRPREAAVLVRQIAEAVAYAHAQGVVHRDLKPLNILIDRLGQPKVTDFGLAKMMQGDSGLSISGEVLGTPSYMAPEQAAGRVREIGPAADIYALGAILYCVLTSRPPFQAPSRLETLSQVIHNEPVPPRRMQPNVDRDLETICLKCLAKSPGRRYAKALDLADDLERYLDGVPVRARRTPGWERAAKWARRHPTVSTLLALAAISLAVGTGAWVRYKDARARRQQQQTVARLIEGQKEAKRIAALHSYASDTLYNAQGLLAKEAWNDARPVLSSLSTQLRNEPALKDEMNRATDLLAQADHGNAEQVARAHEREQLAGFLRLRDETLFHATRFTGLDLPNNREAIRRSARAALAVFAAAGPTGGWTLGRLPTNLTEADAAAVRDGCYELLLILAEAEDQPRAGLGDLDAAARLNLAPTRAYHVHRANCLARCGEQEAAAGELRRASGSPPVKVIDFFLAGQERYDRGDWPSALNDFEHVLQNQPDHFWAHALSAICLLQRSRPAVARAELNACLQSKPELPWLYLLRGFASTQNAELVLKASGGRAAETRPLPPEVVAHLDLAEADYDRAKNRLRDRPHDELNYVVRVNRGLLKIDRRDYTAAEASLEEAVRIDPRPYQPYTGLALIRQRQHRLDEAIEYYGRAIASKPDYAPLYRGRAELELSRDDATPAQRGAALRDLEQAIRLTPPRDPLVARDQTNRGRLLHRDGHDGPALEACDAALALVADSREAHLLRVEILVDLRRFDEAARSCETALAKGVSSPELHELRGLTRDGRREFAGAIDDFSRALALRPGWTRVLLYRGWDYLMENAPELALRDFEDAIRLDPASASARNGRGTARVCLGRFREGVADADEALRLGGNAPEVAYKAARVYALASGAAASGVRRTGRDAVVLVGRYQDRALALAHLAVDRTPAEKRAAYIHDVLEADPALRLVSRRLNLTALPKPSLP